MFMNVSANIVPSLTTGFFGMAGVILAAWLASRFTAGRFFTERTWDRKANAYSTVFEALHTMQHWTGQELDAYYEGRELTKGTAEKLRSEYSAAKDRIRKEIAGATWLLKPEVEAEINELWKVLTKRYESWHDDMETSYGGISRAQARLRVIARVDLGLEKPKRNRRWPLKRESRQAV
jgi:hypothetical protein